MVCTAPVAKTPRRELITIPLHYAEHPRAEARDTLGAGLWIVARPMTTAHWKHTAPLRRAHRPFRNSPQPRPSHGRVTEIFYSIYEPESEIQIFFMDQLHQ